MKDDKIKGVTFEQLVEATKKDARYKWLKTDKEVRLFVADCLEELERAGWIGSRRMPKGEGI